MPEMRAHYKRLKHGMAYGYEEICTTTNHLRLMQSTISSDFLRVNNRGELSLEVGGNSAEERDDRYRRQIVQFMKHERTTILSYIGQDGQRTVLLFKIARVQTSVGSKTMEEVYNDICLRRFATRTEEYANLGGRPESFNEDNSTRSRLLRTRTSMIEELVAEAEQLQLEACTGPYKDTEYAFTLLGEARRILRTAGTMARNG